MVRTWTFIVGIITFTLLQFGGTAAQNTKVTEDNIAFNKSAESGPLDSAESGGTYPAGHAVNGNTSAVRTLDNCAYALNPGQSEQPWWKVIFGPQHVIKSVTIYNRDVDEPYCPNCPWRLWNTEITVDNGTASVTCRVIGEELLPNNLTVSFGCVKSLKGTELLITRVGGPSENELNLCEVEVFGYLYQPCDGFFGPGCSIPCNCQGECDDVTGICDGDCIPGKNGTTCQDDCQDGTWGLSCSKSCRCKDPDEICRNANGSCVNGCEENVVGIGCDKDLPSLNDTMPVIVTVASTSLIVTFNATALSSSDDTDPTGYRVQYRAIPDDVWQNGTEITADNATKAAVANGESITADNATEAAIANGRLITADSAIEADTASGGLFTADNATELATASGGLITYTLNQSNLEPDQSYEIRIVPILHYEELWQIGIPSQVTFHCGNKSWDIGCNTSCNCAVPCDVYTGYCPSNCLPGYQGTACQADCPDGTHGVGCTGLCFCKDNLPCEKDTGLCEECEEYVIGQTCNIRLPSMEDSNLTTPHITNESVTIRFTVSTNGTDATGYRIQYKEKNGWINGIYMTEESSPEEPSRDLTQEDLKPGTKYVLRVEAILSHEGMNYSGHPSTHVNAMTHGDMPDGSGGSDVLAIVLGIVIPLIVIVIILTIAYIYWRKSRSARANTSSRAGAEDPRGPQTVVYSNTNNSNRSSSPQPDVVMEPLEKLEEQPLTRARSGSDVSDEDARIYEPIQADSIPRYKPILVKQLADYITHTHKRDDGFSTEYRSLATVPVAKWENARKSCNKAKHRFKDIMAYDQSRVILARSCRESQFEEYSNIDVTEDDNDYINANFIRGYNNRQRAYIAAQAPTPNTVADMWRMIWQQRINRIVMVTNLLEAGRVKCERYWPEEGSMEIGDFTITLNKTEIFADYTQRELSVKCHEKRRLVRQFHFTGWPDHGVPTIAATLLDFRRKVRVYDGTSKGPLLVHCSAGIGRTGTYIAIDMQIDKANEEGMVNVPECVIEMRKDRINMVQTQAQYEFVYEGLREALCLGETAIASNKTQGIYQSLLQKNPSTKKIKLEDQFEMLRIFDTVLNKHNDKLMGLEEINRDKNRSLDIIPFEHVRPRLVTRMANCNEYINAAYVSGHRKRGAYITTQWPLPETVGDIWRLLFDHKSRTLVTLVDHDSADETRPIFWPETSAEPLVLPPLKMELNQEVGMPTGNILVRDVRITDMNQGKQSSRSVKQFVLQGWKATENLPPSNDALFRLIESIEKWQQNSGNTPITVHCTDGALQSGFFVAANFLLDKLKVDREVDVCHVVKQIRLSRLAFIPNLEQFQCLHEFAIEYMKKYDDYANFTD